MAGHEGARCNIGAMSLNQEIWRELWNIGLLLRHLGIIMPWWMPWDHTLKEVWLVENQLTQRWKLTIILMSEWEAKQEMLASDSKFDNLFYHTRCGASTCLSGIEAELLLSERLDAGICAFGYFYGLWWIGPRHRFGRKDLDNVAMLSFIHHLLANVIEWI